MLSYQSIVERKRRVEKDPTNLPESIYLNIVAIFGFEAEFLRQDLVFFIKTLYQRFEIKNHPNQRSRYFDSKFDVRFQRWYDFTESFEKNKRNGRNVNNRAEITIRKQL